LLRKLCFRCCFSLSLFASAAAAQSFRNPPMVPTAFDPVSIATADFNGDGIPDLAYDTADLNGTGTTLHILLGKGDGTYNDAQDIGLPFPLGGRINIADVNGDGKPDLILGGGGASTTQGTVATLFGNGDGTFGAPVISTFSVSSGQGGYISTEAKMGIGDINGDGAVDLVIPDAENTSLYILLGNKTGQFQYSGKIYNGSYPGEAFLADLNGDGRLDLVALGPLGGNATVYLGNGNGTFTSGVTYNLGPGPLNMLLTDLDGDGHLDIVAEAYAETSTQDYPQIVFLHGNPDGTFAAATPIVSPLPATVGMLIDAADYNGDGIPDLIVTDQVGIGFLPGKGNLTYGPLVSYLSGPINNSGNIVFGNLTASGHRDIAMGAEGGIVELLGNGDGTFSSAPFYDLGNTVGAAAIADFNGDGNPDIAVTVPAEYPRVLLGKGDGTFQLETDQNISYGTNKPASSIAAADFTGTHVYDLSGPSSGGPVTTGTAEVSFGNGNGTFQAPLEESSASTEIADFNGDGRADMVSLTGTDIVVLLGQAGGTFTQANTMLRLPNYASGVTAIGDLNGDGKPDVVIGSQIWLGNGDGTFTYKQTLDLPSSVGATSTAYGSAAIADVDGDGKADLILFGGSGPQDLVILYGNGDGTFQSPVLIPISHGYDAMTVADVNKDGKPDFVLNDSAGIAVILNLGNRNYAPEQHYVAGGVVGTVSVADLNHDGYPDIVVTNGENSTGSTVAVLLNQPSIPLPGGQIPNGSLVLSPEPTADLQPFQATLTLTSPSTGGVTPTGVVTFSVDGTFTADEPLNAGVAVYSNSGSLSPGVHTISAAFDGDQNYRSTSFLGFHTVNGPVYATSTALTVAPTSVYTSQTVHMQATVTTAGIIPISYVTFLDGNQTLAAVQLNSSGVVYFDTSLLAPGTHSIVAQYDGDDYQNGYPPEVLKASSSAPVVVTVADVPTVTTLSSSSATPTNGTVLTLTASVTSTSGTPDGGVTFFDGTTQLGTMPLDGGQATFSTASLGTGQHTLTATYNANAIWGSSTSLQQKIGVQLASARLIPTFTSVSAVPSSTGQGIQLAALVSSGAATPQGTVTFLMDGTVLGTAPADQSGSATLLSTAASLSGQHVFWASFGGDATYAPSVSPALDRSWQSAGSGFSLNLDANTVLLSPSSPATIHVVISAPAGSSETISLSCAAGVPQGYSCVFSPSSLSPSGVSILTISANQLFRRTSGASWRLKGALGISLSLLLFLPVVKRKTMRWLVLLLALSSIVVMPSGCSVSTLNTQADEVSILVVTASAGTGSSTVVNSSQLTVQVRP
jgi:Big-like domain-containing protein/VCBS repeat protein/FG-GAP repeat protein